MLLSPGILLSNNKARLNWILKHLPFGVWAVDIHYNIVFIEIYKTQNKVHPIPNYSVNINRLPSLQPAVCTYFIPSLLLSADVQTFCSEKESLFVTLESFKERETTRPLPVSPSATIQPTKQQIPISNAESALHHAAAPPTRVSCKVQIIGLDVIHQYLEKTSY